MTDGRDRTAIGTVVDEIGIEIGVCGDWRLKSTFLPVFARHDGSLQPAAVEASLTPFDLGREVDWSIVQASLGVRGHHAMAAAKVALALRNLQHTGRPDLKLVVDAGFGTGTPTRTIRAAVRALSNEIARNYLRPVDIHIEVTALAQPGGEALHAACAALRRGGVGVALRENGSGLPDLPAGCFADLVIVDAGWFDAVARHPTTAYLFGALVRGYHAHDALVLVEGISSPQHLAVALDSCADWFCGPLLAPSALAGAIFPDERLDIEMLQQRGRVIPLFG